MNILLFFCILSMFWNHHRILCSIFSVPNVLANVLVCLYSLLLISNGYVQTIYFSNCKEYFLICHWNLNNSKLFLLKAYVILSKFNIICLSEIYCDSTTPINGDKLQIPGYTLICSDRPSNKKHGGVCVYYKSSLPLTVTNIGYLHKWLRFELQIGNKICTFVPLIDPQANLRMILKLLLIILKWCWKF